MLPTVPTVITFISCMPFVVLSLFIAMDVADIPNILELLTTYAAIILSFLAGIKWGMAVDHQDVHDQLADRLCLISTAMLIPTWVVLFIPDPLSQLLCLTLLFTIAWGIDSMLHDDRIIPLWFFTLRSIVTPIVIVSLYVSYFSII